MALGDTAYLDYEIHLTDEAEVAALQAADSRFNSPPDDPAATTVSPFPQPFITPGFLYCSPALAGVLYGGPVVGFADALAASPKVTSVWIKSITQTDYPINQHFFEHVNEAQTGKFPPGTVIQLYRWRGRFIFNPNVADDVVEDDTPEAIKQRRWIEGWAWPGPGAGGAVSGGALGHARMSREAARGVDAWGFGQYGSPNGWQQTYLAHGLLNQPDAWERFYTRLRTYPTDETTFWLCRTSPSPSVAVVLKWTPTGTIKVYSRNLSSVETFIAETTEAFALDAVLKVDLVFEVGATAFFELWVNGVEQIQVASFPAGGIQTAATHSGSFLGNVAAGEGDHYLGAHYMDWHNADVPIAKTGLDWVIGSRCLRIDPVAIPAPGSWTPVQPSWLLKNPAVQTALTYGIATTANDDEIRVAFDPAIAVREPFAIGGGIVAAVLGAYGLHSGGTDDGDLGLDVNGDGFTDRVVTWANATIAWKTVLYRPSGLTAPVPVESLTGRLVSPPTGTAMALHAMGLTVQVLGIFGPEDVPPAPPGLTPASSPPPLAGTHMTVYGPTPWARAGAAPVSSVLIRGATYVGNGTETILTFDEPPTFVMARRVTATEGMSTVWWSSGQVARLGFSAQADPSGAMRVEPDPAGGYRVRIVGDQDPANDAGATYQYVAVVDPGMRFSLNGLIRHHTGPATRETPIWKPTFLPEALFLHQLVGAGASTAVTTYHKGPGSAAAGVSPLNAAELADRVSMAVGAITTQSAFHDTAAVNSFAEISWSAWRKDDGSGDPGVPDVVKIFSYVGNGSGSRTIQFSPVSTQRPLFAIVSPVNGASLLRDPSHTGTTSSAIGIGTQLTPNASTGIIAGGINEMTVGAALNANGVVHNVFVLMGGTEAGENGWSANGEVEPVAPATPDDWPGEDTPDEDDFTEAGDGGGGGGGGGTPVEPGGDDFGDQCVGASTKVLNQALSEIGIDQPIVDVTTDQTREAALARLHYGDAVAETLREFTWPLFTRYVTLVHVSGSEALPVNGDWTYAFRAPADMMFARRLVRPERKRRYDPCPPPFRLGSDTDRLVYTDYLDPDATDAAPAVELEYTFRPSCAATLGDALFREALKWKCAAKLAPALSRNKVTATDALQKYFYTLQRAQVEAAREQQHQDDGTGLPSWLKARDGHDTDDPWRRG